MVTYAFYKDFSASCVDNLVIHMPIVYFKDSLNSSVCVVSEIQWLDNKQYMRYGAVHGFAHEEKLLDTSINTSVQADILAVLAKERFARMPVYVPLQCGKPDHTSALMSCSKMNDGEKKKFWEHYFQVFGTHGVSSSLNTTDAREKHSIEHILFLIKEGQLMKQKMYKTRMTNDGKMEHFFAIVYKYALGGNNNVYIYQYTVVPDDVEWNIHSMDNIWTKLYTRLLQSPQYWWCVPEHISFESLYKLDGWE